MKRFSIIIFWIFLLARSVGYAQNSEGDKLDDLDQRYTPNKNSIFNGKENTHKDMTVQFDNDNIRHVFKFYPTLLGRATVAIFYERFLAKKYISLQGGFGFCFDQDFLQASFIEEAWLDIDVPSNFLNKFIFDEIVQNGTFVSGANLFGGLSIRFNSDKHDQLRYFEIESRFYRNTLQLNQGKDPYSLFPNSPIVNVNYFSEKFNYGIIFIAERAGKYCFTHDLHIGFGLRFPSFNKFIQGYNYFGYIKTSERESLTKLTVALIGYSVGFAIK